jgi:hypothetical protein
VKLDTLSSFNRHKMLGIGTMVLGINHYLRQRREANVGGVGDENLSCARM